MWAPIRDCPKNTDTLQGDIGHSFAYVQALRAELESLKREISSTRLLLASGQAPPAMQATYMQQIAAAEIEKFSQLPSFQAMASLSARVEQLADRMAAVEEVSQHYLEFVAAQQTKPPVPLADLEPKVTAIMNKLGTYFVDRVHKLALPLINKSVEALVQSAVQSAIDSVFDNLQLDHQSAWNSGVERQLEEILDKIKDLEEHRPERPISTPPFSDPAIIAARP